MKKVLITQSNYIPWKGYFDAINTCDEFVIYDTVQFTRRDWRNRNKIKTPNGTAWLTIPVDVKGKYLQKINETKVSDPGWGEKHWKTIQHNYSKSKYFAEYKSWFEPLFIDDSEVHLSKINFNFITAICSLLDIRTRISWADEFQATGDKTERLVAICKELKGTDYYTGPAARDYIDETLFEKSNISLHYFDFGGYPEYDQLYPPFIHEVSILDLLFNEGRNAKQFMKSFGR